MSNTTEMGRVIALEMGLDPDHVTWTLEQLARGRRPSFLAHHRPDETGGLDAATIRHIQDRSDRLTDLERRRQTILEAARKAGRAPLADFEGQVAAARNRRELEDLYLPLRSKARTRGATARGRGLEPLADELLAQQRYEGDVIDVAGPFVDPAREVGDVVSALTGAIHIVAERIAQDPIARGWIREATEADAAILAELRGPRPPDPLLEIVADILGLPAPPPLPAAPSTDADGPRSSGRLGRLGVFGESSDDELRSPGLGPTSDDFTPPESPAPLGRPSPSALAPPTIIGPTSDDFAPEDSLAGGMVPAPASTPASTPAPGTGPMPRGILSASAASDPGDGPIGGAGDDPVDANWPDLSAPGDASPYASLAGARLPLDKPDEALLLAINRGERERVLQVTVDGPADLILAYLEGRWLRGHSIFEPLIREAIRHAYERILAPSIGRDVRAQAVMTAERRVIDAACAELRRVMGGPCLPNGTVLAIVPGYRLGCRIAVVTGDGRLVTHSTIWPLPPTRRVEEAEAVLAGLIEAHAVDVVVSGAGIANRDADVFVRRFLARYHRGDIEPLPPKPSRPGSSDDAAAPPTSASATPAARAPRRVRRTVLPLEVASDYGASKIGRAEFPKLDGTGRSAVALARRVLDPLTELTKVDPRSLLTDPVVADVAPRRLREALNAEIEDLVCLVGADLNAATWSLLSYVPGIGTKLARIIIDNRNRDGRFERRADLSRVPGVDEAVLDDAIAFLRVIGGPDLLDATALHPESRTIVEELARGAGVELERLIGHPSAIDELDWSTTSARLGAARAAALRRALERGARDDRPRFELDAPEGVTTLRDLRPGMDLDGTVTHITEFGAFVNIGVDHDGLVHVSQLAERYVGHPEEVVTLGEAVSVRVLGVDLERKRVSLSMRADTPPPPPPRSELEPTRVGGFVPASAAGDEPWDDGLDPAARRRLHKTGQPHRFRPGARSAPAARGGEPETARTSPAPLPATDAIPTEAGDAPATEVGDAAPAIAPARETAPPSKPPAPPPAPASPAPAPAPEPAPEPAPAPPPPSAPPVSATEAARSAAETEAERPALASKPPAPMPRSAPPAAAAKPPPTPRPATAEAAAAASPKKKKRPAGPKDPVLPGAADELARRLGLKRPRKK